MAAKIDLYRNNAYNVGLDEPEFPASISEGVNLEPANMNISKPVTQEGEALAADTIMGISRPVSSDIHE